MITKNYNILPFILYREYQETSQFKVKYYSGFGLVVDFGCHQWIIGKFALENGK